MSTLPEKSRSRSTSASEKARRWSRMPESGICCSIATLKSAPLNMNGKWSSDGEIMGSGSGDTMAGRASPALVRARAACISSLRSPAIRMTSARASGEVVASSPAQPRRQVLTSPSAPAARSKKRSVHVSSPIRRSGPATIGPCLQPLLPPRFCELLVHLRNCFCFLRFVSRQAHQTIAVDRCLGDPRSESVSVFACLQYSQGWPAPGRGRRLPEAKSFS